MSESNSSVTPMIAKAVSDYGNLDDMLKNLHSSKAQIEKYNKVMNQVNKHKQSAKGVMINNNKF